MSEHLEFAPDTPLSLKEAADVLLRGLVKASTLRAAADRGELEVERLGRRIVTTPADVLAWRKSCRTKAEAHTSISNAGKTAKRSVTSVTGDSEQALAAALRTIKALKEGSRQGHAENGGGPGVRLKKRRRP